AHSIVTLVDVRRVPRSKRNPHFNAEALESALPRAGLGYRYLEILGGLRKTIGSASSNRAWRNLSFRGFADYMQTPEFDRGMAELLEIADQAGPPAIMCAEALWWRCHRSLITDALLARGLPVGHILPNGSVEPARLTPFAAVSNGRVTYPGPPQLSFEAP
ncbi:MAG: DUF488 family protein, partial [Acidimicrobiia bacterium]